MTWNWLALFGAVGTVLNAIFAIWRWRADRTFVAWTFSARLEADRYFAIVTNSGDATAFNVTIRVNVPNEPPHYEGGALVVTRPHVFSHDSIQVELGMPSTSKVRIEWRDKPNGKQRSGTWDVTNGRDLTATWRERLAVRVAGKPIRR